MLRVWNLRSYLDFLEGFQQAQTVTKVTRRKMPPVDKMMYRELLPRERGRQRCERDAGVVRRASHSGRKRKGVRGRMAGSLQSLPRAHFPPATVFQGELARLCLSPSALASVAPRGF